MTGKIAAALGKPRISPGALQGLKPKTVALLFANEQQQIAPAFLSVNREDALIIKRIPVDLPLPPKEKK